MTGTAEDKARQKADALERVSRYLPQLERENETELVGAVRLIGRALKSAGLDFHELAKEVLERSKAIRPAMLKTEPVVPRPSKPGDPFRGADPFAARPKRSARPEDFRAYAFGGFAPGGFSPGSSDFVSRAVSKALLDELDPRLEELGASDRAFVSLVEDKLSRGELLSRTNHQMLLDIVQRFRRQS